ADDLDKIILSNNADKCNNSQEIKLVCNDLDKIASDNNSCIDNEMNHHETKTVLDSSNSFDNHINDESRQEIKIICNDLDNIFSVNSGFPNNSQIDDELRMKNCQNEIYYNSDSLDQQYNIGISLH
ncbi:23767_t:CDS:1, partial [Gigaspora margarita]